MKRENEMVIRNVISYNNSWHLINNQYKTELDDISGSLNQLLQYLKHPNVIIDYSNMETNYNISYNFLKSKGWEKSNFRIPNMINSPIDFKFYEEINDLGLFKNGVSCVMSNDLHSIDKWLFESTVIADNHDLIKIPILIIIFDSSYNLFNSYLAKLRRISPLNIDFPFLIMEVVPGENTRQDIFFVEPKRLSEGSLIKVERYIEFPPEFYQAGINIINYFGTYVREQYPDENTKVKIEQAGSIVKLIIETEDGKREIIEKALHEYQLIIKGERQPEEITNNKRLVLELKNELRLAKYRIETQYDIIKVQSSRVDKLLDIIGNGLSKNQPLTIDFNPSISISNTNTNTINIDQKISSAIGSINEIKELLSSSSLEQIELNELKKSLESIEKERNPEVVKKSAAMSKFRRFLEKVNDRNKDLKKIIETTSGGVDIFRDLAGKYNKIAEWCGLPQVPSIFTK